MEIIVKVKTKGSYKHLNGVELLMVEFLGTLVAAKDPETGNTVDFQLSEVVEIRELKVAIDRDLARKMIDMHYVSIQDAAAQRKGESYDKFEKRIAEISARKLIIEFDFHPLLAERYAEKMGKFFGTYDGRVNALINVEENAR